VTGPIGREALFTAIPVAVLGPLWLATLPGLVARARRARGVERLQLKWFASSAVVAAAMLSLAGLAGAVRPGSPVLGELPLAAFILCASLIPVTIGIAILRYRLYDIDVVIRRTLVYAVVTAILGGVYVGLVLGLQAVLTNLTGGDTLPVALSTLAIAGLFGPVRSRARDLVDRRFYRAHYDAQRTLTAFAAGLRDELEMEALGRALRDVAVDTLQPAVASVWVRGRP
jgi:hypothetical protein